MRKFFSDEQKGDRVSMRGSPVILVHISKGIASFHLSVIISLLRLYPVPEVLVAAAPISHLTASPKMCGVIGANRGLNMKQSMLTVEKPAFHKREWVFRFRLQPSKSRCQGLWIRS